MTTSYTSLILQTILTVLVFALISTLGGGKVDRSNKSSTPIASAEERIDRQLGSIIETE